VTAPRAGEQKKKRGKKKKKKKRGSILLTTFLTSRVVYIPDLFLPPVPLSVFK
jgi:hypothetical protein